MSSVSPAIAYAFAISSTSYSKDFHKYQNIVLRSRNPLYLFMFASLPGADVLRIQKALEPHMDGVMAYKFALSIPDARVDRLQRIVLKEMKKFRNAKVAYQFARDVIGADLDLLEREISRIGDPGWSRAFTLFIRGEQ